MSRHTKQDLRAEFPWVTGSLGPFVTRVTRLHADHRLLLRTSRRHRKGLAPILVSPSEGRPGVAGEGIRHHWLHVWAPRRLGWWIAVLFMIGSALFALGGLQATWPALGWLNPTVTGGVFFAGSVFFTAAAYLQWLEALNNDVAALAGPNRRLPPWRFFDWHPHNLGFLSASVQLVGTLLFNLNTGDALITGLGWEDQDVLIWTPDLTGSICFLAASQLALMEFSHGYWSVAPRNLSWWILAINLLGSILFQISAFASFVEPGAAILAPWIANFGTFAGAVCFLVGAYLLIPELFERVEPVAA